MMLTTNIRENIPDTMKQSTEMSCTEVCGVRIKLKSINCLPMKQLPEWQVTVTDEVNVM